MDLRKYFRKVREMESSITETFPLVISLETSDGGRSGVATEVPRLIAAAMIVDGRAVLASQEEKELYIQRQTVAKKDAEKAELAKRVQVAIISDPDLQNQFSGKRSPSNGGK